MLNTTDNEDDDDYDKTMTTITRGRWRAADATKMPRTTTTTRPRTPKNDDADYYDAKEPMMHRAGLGAQHLFTNWMFIYQWKNTWKTTIWQGLYMTRWHNVHITRCSRGFIHVHVHGGRQRRLPTLRLEEPLSSSSQYAFHGMVNHKSLQRHGTRFTLMPRKVYSYAQEGLLLCPGRFTLMPRKISYYIMIQGKFISYYIMIQGRFISYYIIREKFTLMPRKISNYIMIQGRFISSYIFIQGRFISYYIIRGRFTIMPRKILEK